jgi:hypothetical protein
MLPVVRVLAVLLIALPGRTLWAAPYPIEANALVRYDAERLALELSVVSRGSMLMDVFPWVRLGAEEVELERVERLGARGAARWLHRFEAGTLELLPVGIHPLFVLVHYHDSTLYSFSTPLVLEVDRRSKPAPVPLEAAFEVGAPEAPMRASFELRNASSHEIGGSIELFLPAELEAEEGTRGFRLDAGEQKRFQFRMRSNGARPGSAQSIYAVAQFLDGAQHGLLVREAELRVPARSAGRSVRPEVMALAGFIVLGFLLTGLAELRAAQQAR